MTSFNVFISHASIDSDTANVLNTQLRERGIHTWFAPDEIKGGKDFASEIIDGIEQCSVMLLLITPASNNSPHVLREVNHAIARKMHILPVRLTDIKLSKSMAYYLSHVQWVDAYEKPLADYFPLIEQQLISLAENHTPAEQPKGWTPNLLVSQQRKSIWAGGLLALVVVLLLGLVGERYYTLFHNQSQSISMLTEVQQDTLRRMSIDIANALGYVDLMLDDVEQTTRMTLDYYDSVLRRGPDVSKQQAIVDYIHEVERHREGVGWVTSWDKSLLLKFPEQAYHMQDIQALFEMWLPNFKQEVDDFYSNTSYDVLNTKGWLDEQRRVFELRRDYLKITGEAFYFGAIEIFADYPSDLLADSDRMLLTYRHLPVTNRPDGERARLNLEAALNQAQLLLADLSTIVGNANVDIQGKQRDIKQQVSAVETELRTQCTLESTDAPGIMWGKIIRLQRAGLYDDVYKQLDNFQRFNLEVANTNIIVRAAKAYTKQAENTGIDYGAMIFQIENDAPHPILHPGDIVIELNGQRVLNSDSYIKIKHDTGDSVNEYRYLRVNELNQLQEYSAKGHSDDPRIGVIDMVEQRG